MDSEDRESDAIPCEVRAVLKALSNDDRIGILVALINDGKMTFKELKGRFGLSPSSLSNHLTALQNGGLIENFYKKRDENGFSYYDVTDVPEQVFDALFAIVYKMTPEKTRFVAAKAGLPEVRALGHQYSAAHQPRTAITAGGLAEEYLNSYGMTGV